MSRSVRLQRLLLLTAAMALATVALGWAGPLIVATVFAIIDRHPSVPAEAGVGAAIAWAIVFVVNAIVPGGGLTTLVGRAMGLPTVILPIATILFPAMLAWSGATVVVALSGLIGRPRHAGVVGEAAVTRSD